jgi:hypothetical protein
MRYARSTSAIERHPVAARQWFKLGMAGATTEAHIGVVRVTAVAMT